MPFIVSPGSYYHQGENLCICWDDTRHKYEQSAVGMINFPREIGDESLEPGLKVCRISTGGFGGRPK